jgi:hypothetical protein
MHAKKRETTKNESKKPTVLAIFTRREKLNNLIPVLKSAKQ